jgi:hypothetical protein
LVVSALGVLFGCAWMLTGCDASQTRTPRASEAWSKGLPLGMTSLNNQVALAVDEDGYVYTVWVGLSQDLHFVRLDQQAGVVTDRVLDVGTNRPQQPRLVLDADGQLHLTWIDRQGNNRGLFYARLSADGEVLQGAQALSSPDRRVAYSMMALNPVERTLELFWSDNAPSQPGCYHATLAWSGSVLVPAEDLIPDGLSPAAQVDRQGFVHLAWKTKPEGQAMEFHYAVYDPRSRLLGPDIRLSQSRLNTSMLDDPVSALYNGPWLGLSDELVYVAWAVESREHGGLAAFTFYQAFPQPSLVTGENVTGFDYVLPEVTSAVIPVRLTDPTLTGHPSFLSGQQAQQVLACYTQDRGPNSLETLQSAVVSLDAGQMDGYQVVGATAGASMQPNVAIDARGYLHLVWIDTAGFEQYRVIYASTAPQVQRVLNRTTVSEVLDRVFSVSFSAVTLIGLLPLYLFWALPSFVVLVGFYLATHATDLSQRQGVVALVAAIVVQMGVKIATTGGLSTWQSLGGLLATPGLGGIIRWLVPLVITGLAAGVMVLYVRRTGTDSVISSYLVFLLADAVLFSGVYLAPLLGTT